MAAKVVMVAVPTVLGIASIRVYSVKDASTDGLVYRDRLNIYTPLSGTDPLKVVPESPGLIERGLTTSRKSVLPFVQAVKGACVSVKRGSVNLYHAGEDVYYFLIDPPPGFLPRLGTITMAGLLGMFLARKGSRFKRLAVPLGLMSAGGSVCYPAQAVSVLKVTGQKVYAAGLWSSAAVSSLLTTKEPVAKEINAAQSQPSSEPDPESALPEEASASSSTSDTSAKSSAILKTKVESAESVPISDEPLVTVTTEKESSVALTGISPTETDTGSSADSEPVQTELSRPSEEAAPVESEEASGDVSFDTTPADPSPSSELETVQDESAAAISADESAPSSEGNVPSVPVVGSVAEFESAEEQSLPAVEEKPTSTPITLPPPQQPAEKNRKEGSGFKSDPALMDFGQSSPEDEDLYSTRS
ncbi:MICOS complex subunit MIC27 [Anableps anableps]